MADALVSIALEKLANVAEKQLSLFAGAAKELQKLSFTFESIQALLADAESRQVGDRSVKLWLSRLRHAAYDIQDLLEDGLVSGLGEERDEDDRNSRNKLCLCFPLPYNPSIRYKIARDIKEIRQRLDLIDVERNMFSFNSSTQGGDQGELVRSQRLTISLMEESEMIIGRENDEELMISRLVGESSHGDGGQVHVVAICGIGGQGKTTLARKIYNDGRVQGHFDSNLYWVCVSEVFDVIRLTKAVLEQVKRTVNFPSELDTLQKELLEALRGKRFLLVLDDVWNDEAEKWEMLRLSLKSGAHGSRILVTTRSQKVADAMNAAFIHELKGLSDHDSWELFKSKAFAMRKAEEVLDFENVGKKIVNKCYGVPLSIKVIGNAMNSKRTVDDWEKILESKIWSLPQVTNKIIPPLLLTYCNLPTHLKPCFVYCSMFPKDWEFEKDMLVSLWVVQGFIQLEGNREIKDIGEEYFDDLVARSMFQQVDKHAYTMHDLLHDLAEFVTKDEIYCSEGGESEESSSCNSNVRHAFLSFVGSYDRPSNIPIASGRAKKLRTLCLIGPVYGGFNSVIDDIFHQARFLRALHFPYSTTLPKSIGKLEHLRYLHLPRSNIAELPDAIGRMKQLRVLQLPYSEIVTLPNAIGKLEQLRYLDLFGNSNLVELPESVSDLRNLHTLNLSHCCRLEKLPRGIGEMVSLRYLDLSNNSNIVELSESVSHLRNLHTLNLTHCRELEKLPRGIGQMVGLRHLEIEWTFRLKYLPKGLGRISGLRSLCKFIVGGGDEGEGCGIDELQPLNSLQGSLEIEHLERVSSREEAEKAELWKKQYLCKLVLEMPREAYDDYDYYRDYRVAVADDVDVDVDNDVDGDDDDHYDDAKTGTIDSVLEGLRPHENLEELKIWGFTGSKLPSWMDGMLRLRKLGLYYGPKLEQVPHLPSLKKFHIEFVRNEILPDEGWERLAAMHKMSIQKCRELKCLPDGLTQLPSLENLCISWCHRLKSLPKGLGQLQKLKSLEVGGLKVLRCLPDSLGQLESLESLYMWLCKRLESLPVSLGQLKKLKSLRISSLEVLRCLPNSLGQLESLESLDISYCGKLESLPVSLGQLKKLKSLKVGGSVVLTCLPDSVGSLESLESLEISCCRKLESLPILFGQLKKLKSLTIDNLGALRCLPDSVGQLESLESLRIYESGKLESLPQGLRHLSLLRYLDIRCCPLLSERCKREGGVDWPNISHISTIDIQDRYSVM